MKQTKLSQAGRSSLQNWSQGLPSQKAPPNVLLSFKAGSALNKQLMKQHPKQAKTLSNTKELIEQARLAKEYEKLHAVSQEQKLMAEVKNLSDFKPIATKEKTKLMVEQIIANKREQHLRVYNQFLEETMNNYNMVKEIEESTKTEKLQFFNLNRRQFEDLTQSLTDEVLLTKEKSLLSQLQTFANQNQVKRKERLDGVRESLLALYNDIKERYHTLIQDLKGSFRDIAFVLEDEATSICLEETKRLTELIDASIERVNGFVDQLIITSQTEFNSLKATLLERGDRWRIVNKQHRIQEFIEKLTDPLFSLFVNLQSLQEKVHVEREKLVLDLLSIELNDLSKQSVQKWLESIRVKSEQVNNNVDTLFNQLVAEVTANKQKGAKELEALRENLLHIGADSNQVILEIIAQQCEPLITKNQEQQKQLLSKGISYVEKYQSLENDVCEKLGKWMLGLGAKTDEYKKRLEQSKQTFEIEKAKILDDDQEKIDKLKEDLQGYKKELKESLHHPKLEEIQEKCFVKVDELEQHYREVYESNKTLINKHPQSISHFYDQIEREVVEIFHLVDPQKKEEFLAKVRANNEKLALRQIEKEDVVRAQEAEKAREEETKKKGGKAPPPVKPKDPKKAAAELEERKQAIIKGMGPPAVEELTVNGRVWIVAKDIEDMSNELYAEPNPDIENPPPVDFVQEPIKDKLGDSIVSQNVVIKVDLVKQKLEEYRDRAFLRMIQNRDQTMKRETQSDKKYLTESLQILDDRLKTHYPMKSIIESQIIGKRSTEINSHKKRYERHARTTREKVDEQTERFNYLLEKSLEATKSYNEQRKLIKEDLGNVKNISNFQGISRKARESNDTLDNEMKEILKELKRLAGNQLDLLITKNNDFMKEIAGSSEYAKEELEWYTNMMNEVSVQLKEQKEKRAEKILEIETHSKKKKEELVQSFEKEYAVGMDDMAAKDCAGNKYGKPKMIAQERLRAEMSKCEKAQENINGLMGRLREVLGGGESVDVLDVRQQLMTIRSCMGKYIKHIEGLNPEAKATETGRVNYTLSRPDTVILPAQKQQDEKRKLREIQALGLLSEQKEDKKYSFCISDITRIVKQEVAKIYVGDKVKFLNADKIPDNLHEYMVALRKNAEGFRLNSIRDLRTSCAGLSEMTKQISERVFESIKEGCMKNQEKLSISSWKQLEGKRSDAETLKALHMKRLSPNLANPASRKQLTQLDQKQLSRAPQYSKFMQSLRSLTFTSLFQNSSSFLNSILNNFQFLVMYYDSLYLFQDFIVLPGDQTNQKKHLNLKQLMLMREKKVAVDTTSERNIVKKWAGVRFDVFDREGNKFGYVKTEVEEVKDTKKAPAKKETKDPKKEVAVVEEVKETKEIQSIKTFRQKSAFVERNRVYEEVQKSYSKETERFKKMFQSIKEEEEVFGSKWKETVDKLKKASD